MAKFPAPPATLSIAADIFVLPAGTKLARVYFAGGAHPGAWNQFRSYGPTASRFDHHEPPSAVHPTKSIIYAAHGPTAAATSLAEVFQAKRVIDRHANSPWLVAFAMTADLRLLNLHSSPWITAAGASTAINSGPRPRARAWSRLFHLAYPDIDGLLYGSSMYGNAPALALYERSQSKFPSLPVFHRALADKALLPYLANAALTMGYALV